MNKIAEGTQMTREEAMTEARKRWGDLGCISHGEDLPRLVWKIGEFDATVGRGPTWEVAFANAAWRADRKARRATKVAATVRRLAERNRVFGRQGTARDCGHEVGR